MPAVHGAHNLPAGTSRLDDLLITRLTVTQLIRDPFPFSPLSLSLSPPFPATLPTLFPCLPSIPRNSSARKETKRGKNILKKEKRFREEALRGGLSHESLSLSSSKEEKRREFERANHRATPRACRRGGGAALGNALGLNCYAAPTDAAGWEAPPPAAASLSPSSSSSSSSSSLSLSLEDGGEGEVGIGVAAARRSFSYYRLPDALLRLSVLKLDGSSFDVRAARSATVSELKTAVEEVFKQSTNEDGVEISWSHVWGHFCLSYEGYRLVDDKTSLRSLGIKDGDQLCFIRHLYTHDNPTKGNPRNHGTGLARHRMSLTGSDVLEEVEEDAKTSCDGSASTSHCEDEESHNNDVDDDIVGNAGSKLCYSSRRRFSYSKLSSAGEKSHRKSYLPRRFSSGCLPIG